MPNSYFNLLLWVAAGCVLGLAAYYIFFATPYPQVVPASVPNNLTVPVIADVNAIIINPDNCVQCNSSDLLLSELTAQASLFTLRINSSSVIKADSPEAASLISKYSIKELPALILSSGSQLNSTFVSLWQQKIGTVEPDGVLVFRQLPFPYYDIANQTVVGLVNGIAIQATGCKDCLDASLFFSSLEAPSIGMVFSNKKVLDRNDSQAVAIISQYNITKLPAVLLSRGAAAYGIFNQKILPLGEFVGDWFVLRNNFPPYVDLSANGTVRGLVQEVGIVNSSCATCFSVPSLASYIQNSTGLTIVNATTYEANSSAAKALILKYHIKYIPTLLYSPGVSYYRDFNSSWLSTNSTIENDGWFVFRSQPFLNITYQNVSG